MEKEKLEVVRERQGFIAALDQSGGSSAKTLDAYGIPESAYTTEEEMFDLIHEMRKRVFTSPVFTSDKILGSILFYKTMNSKVEDKYTADYLWSEKQIVSFLKVDKGLEEENNNCKLMKKIPDLADQCKLAVERGVFGTKMRSVIYDANEEGIKEVVDQQFEFAKVICAHDLVPIIEPEVDINCPNKEQAEEILHRLIKAKLDEWNQENLIMFKFTIPTKANLYLDLYDYKCVVRIVALSGGYSTEEACRLLKQNDKMIASFSRALLQDLNVNQSEEEYNKVLGEAINKIYEASI